MFYYNLKNYFKLYTKVSNAKNYYQSEYLPQHVIIYIVYTLYNIE